MLTTRVAREPYASRRRRLIEARPNGVLVVRGSGPEGPNPNLFYLTGIADAEAILLLAAREMRIETGGWFPGPDYVDGRMVQQVLFLPAGSPMAARWGDQAAATAEGTDPNALGVDAIFPAGAFGRIAAPIFREADRVEIVRADTKPGLEGADDADVRFMRTLRDRFLHLQLGDASDAVHELRRLKSAEELRAIRRCVAVTAAALDRVAARLRPGVGESELESELIGAYREAGGGHAFDPIVGAGAHALQLHYVANSGTVAAGDLVLIDTGAQVDGYCADVTRVFPADGRFTPRQREVYEAVLRAERKAIARCSPQVTLGQIHRTAWNSIETDGFADHFLHGTSHHLGLETHDVGDVHAVLQPGAVITVEPGVYLQDESIGVRIEDDVHVTADGREVLTERIPADAEAVEAWIRREGGGAGHE